MIKLQQNCHLMSVKKGHGCIMSGQMEKESEFLMLIFNLHCTLQEIGRFLTPKRRLGMSYHSHRSKSTISIGVQSRSPNYNVGNASLI